MIKKLCFVLAILIVSCSEKSRAQPVFDNPQLLKTDSLLQDLTIDNQKFTLQLLRNNYNEHLIAFTENSDPTLSQSPITLIVTKIGDNKPLYFKQFQSEPNDYPYVNYYFSKAPKRNLGSSGKLYFTINKSYGGSGSSDNTYFVDYKDGHINLNFLFKSSGELAHTLLKKDDSQIILLEAIWAKGESHYENHRYSIKKFDFKDGQFHESYLGQTKSKYRSSVEEEEVTEILKAIKLKEPLLLKSINVSDFN